MCQTMEKVFNQKLATMPPEVKAKLILYKNLNLFNKKCHCFKVFSIVRISSSQSILIKMQIPLHFTDSNFMQVFHLSSVTSKYSLRVVMLGEIKLYKWRG